MSRKRLLVNPLVISVEHLRELPERDLVAHEPIAVRDDALASEEPRVGRADDEERHRARDPG